MVKMAKHIVRSVALLACATTADSAAYDAKANFGAVGDGSHDDTASVNKAFDTLRNNPGSSLHFPAGKYRVGEVTMAHLTNVQITHDANAEFAMITYSNGKCCNHGDSHCDQWVHAKHWRSVTMTGGTWQGNRKALCGALWLVDDIQDVKIDGTSVNGANYVHFKVRGGHNLDFKNMKLHTGYPTHNTDGLLLASVTKACIDNIDVLNGDDCLKVMDTTSDITFSNGKCQGGHGFTVGGGGKGLKIDGVRWVNMTAIDMNHGAQIKWDHQTEGYVKNIVYEGINMINVAAPIHIDGNYHGGDEKAKMEIGDLNFKDITATYDGKNRNPGGGDSHGGSPLKFHSTGFGCTSKRPCNHVHLHNVHIQTSSSWYCDHCSGDTDGNVSPSAPSSLSKSSDSRRRQAICSPGKWPVNPPPAPGPPSDDRRRRSKDSRRRSKDSRRRSSDDRRRSHLRRSSLEEENSEGLEESDDVEEYGHDELDDELDEQEFDFNDTDLQVV